MKAFLAWKIFLHLASSSRVLWSVRDENNGTRTCFLQFWRLNGFQSRFFSNSYVIFRNVKCKNFLVKKQLEIMETNFLFCVANSPGCVIIFEDRKFRFSSVKINCCSDAASSPLKLYLLFPVWGQIHHSVWGNRARPSLLVVSRSGPDHRVFASEKSNFLRLNDCQQTQRVL